MASIYHSGREAAHHNHEGRLLYLQGDTLAAITHFKIAISLNPNLWEAHYNLAHSFVKLNQFTDAILHYQEVLRIEADHPTSALNLGLLFIQEQDYARAIHYLTAASRFNPENLDTVHQLGNAYLNTGNLAQAKTYYQKALALNPAFAEVHHNLAIVYLREARKNEALLHFKETLILNPQNDTARHMIISLSGEQSNEAPHHYVADLFNQYAEYYNQHVKESLGYQAPALLRSAIGRTLSPHTKACRILDLGCGTGLCGIYFRDMALELIGVDLSPKMIAQAELLNGYESLIVSDINDYLNKPGLAPFDLIVAADVLVYSGALETLFNNVARCLTPTGRFAFTVEDLDNRAQQDDAHPTFYLQPTGRYAHSRSYIYHLAQAYQLHIQVEEKIIPRMHEGAPVPGALYILVK